VFPARPGTILFQAANKTFSCPSGSYKQSFSPGDENLSGRNEASPEACSPDATNGYASENDAFSFCLVSQSSRKTAQCCLENLCVRAIEQRTTANSYPERFQANHEKLYESEKRTELIQTTFACICATFFLCSARFFSSAVRKYRIKYVETTSTFWDKRRRIEEKNESFLSQESE
jgi:hypothetical protein